MTTKANTFMWGWNYYTPQVDPLMTRPRAARLLRSWRRAKTQGNRVFNLARTAPHHYTVAHVDSGERSVMIVAQGVRPV